MPKPSGSQDDMPPWFHGLALEIGTFIREARIDRKQAAEDRRQAALDRRTFNRTLAGILRVGGEFRLEQKKQTGLLEDIRRAVRVRGNGRSGNGK